MTSPFHAHVRPLVRTLLVLLAIVLAFVVVLGPPHGWDPVKLTAGAALSLALAVAA
jgi:hypothetical protein